MAFLVIGAGSLLTCLEALAVTSSVTSQLTSLDGLLDGSARSIRAEVISKRRREDLPLLAPSSSSSSSRSLSGFRDVWSCESGDESKWLQWLFYVASYHYLLGNGTHPCSSSDEVPYLFFTDLAILASPLELPFIATEKTCIKVDLC